MPFYDSAGNEVQAVPVADFKTKEEELTKLQEELAKLKEKDLNFSNLRSQKEDVEKKVETLKSELETKVEQAKKEIVENVLQDHYKDVLGNLAGSDADLSSKIEYHYKRLGEEVKSKADIDKKLRDAWVLAQDRPSTFSNAFATASSVGVYKPAASGAKYTEDEKAFVKRLGAAGGLKITDDDLK